MYIVKCTNSYSIDVQMESLNVNGKKLEGSDYSVKLDRKAGDEYRFKTMKRAKEFWQTKPDCLAYMGKR